MNPGYIFLNLIKGISWRKINDIVTFFGGAQELLKAPLSDLRNVSTLGEDDLNRIRNLRKSNALDKELELIERNNISVIDINDDSYPKGLKEITSPPLVLYVKGDISCLNKFAFAIVGTRIPTPYGTSFAFEFSYKLASLGLVIVSGLARGIDTAVHKGAIKKGKTIAALGSGLLNIYPRQNKRLAKEIMQKGAVISEFPLAEAPLRENFPRRNRIISGLSKGVLVVEAGIRSGALITAHFAAEQNREVFALPGKIDSVLSKGTHKLIKEGAKLVDSLEDILEELNIEFAKGSESAPLTLTLPHRNIGPTVKVDISKGVYP